MAQIEIQGITLNYDKENFNDLELIDWIDDINRGNVLPIKKTIERLFPEDANKIYDKFRNERGIIPIDKVGVFVGEAVEKVAEIKN